MFRYLRDAYPATISSQFSGAASFQAAGSLRTGIPLFVGPDLNQNSFSPPLAVGWTLVRMKRSRETGVAFVCRL